MELFQFRLWWYLERQIFSEVVLGVKRLRNTALCQSDKLRHLCWSLTWPFRTTNATHEYFNIMVVLGETDIF